jgi:hypothetical protein
MKMQILLHDRKVIFGFGAHEPIMHRLRTGNANAREWERWNREEADENLDQIAASGASFVSIACSKGFGLEAEKGLIERAARIREACDKRGLQVRIYTQGLPVYYEEFLRERPEAIHWLARNQSGEFIPWGSQIFRRWMSLHSEEFLDYQKNLLAYCIRTVRPAAASIDNPAQQPWPNFDYSDMAVQAWREHLRRKFSREDAFRFFGIRSVEQVDLPRFDPVFFPPDAIRVVKDPLLQEYCLFRGETFARWVDAMNRAAKAADPDIVMGTNLGCDVWRYNTLFVNGTNLETALPLMPESSFEESGWRPGVVATDRPRGQVILDERNPEGALAGARDERTIRISSSARTHKIVQNFGLARGFGFWGEFDRTSQEIAAAHGMTFAARGNDFGPLGPLAFQPEALANIRGMLDWAAAHAEVLTGRDDRLATVAVWRSLVTTNFVRHTPVWACCAVEQMLLEQHLPFTILLDCHLAACASRSRVVVLPMTSCVSDEQARLLGAYVREGGGLLLLGDAGLRDERTCTRSTHAFASLFGAGALSGLERIGPPHYVPEPDVSRLRSILRAEVGQGRVSLVPRLTPVRELDLTRDPYLPYRSVMPKDVLPPANEGEIMDELRWLLRDEGGVRIEGPRTTLAEYWRQGQDLLICCANLLPDRDGGPLRVFLPGIRARTAAWLRYPETDVQTVTIRDGLLDLPACPRFAAVRVTL